MFRSPHKSVSVDENNRPLRSTGKIKTPNFNEINAIRSRTNSKKRTDSDSSATKVNTGDSDFEEVFEEKINTTSSVSASRTNSISKIENEDNTIKPVTIASTSNLIQSTPTTKLSKNTKSSANFDTASVDTSIISATPTRNLQRTPPTSSLSTASNKLQSTSTTTQDTDTASPAKNSQGRPSLNLNCDKKINTVMALNMKDKMKIAQFARGIPPFCGKRDSFLEESLNKFLTEIRATMDMLDNDQKNYFLSIINSRFDGKASLLIGNRKFDTLEELHDFINLNYAPRKDPSKIISEISSATQRVDESTTPEG